MMQVVGDLDLDSGEFGPNGEEPTEELTSQQTNNVMNMLVNKHLEPDVPMESYMLEVDKRMDIAQYYREILKAPIFATACEASEIVEKKIRDFARGELEVLVGIKQTKVEVVKSPFTEQEVATLKNLAKLNDKELITLNLILAKVLGAESKPEPSVAQVTTPPAKQAPVIVPRKTSQPAMATISTPTTAVEAPTPPKRKPGRPPAVVTVETVDPETGETRTAEVRAPKMRAIKNPNALAMPQGSAMYMATAIASERSARAINRKTNSALETGNDFHAQV